MHRAVKSLFSYARLCNILIDSLSRFRFPVLHPISACRCLLDRLSYHRALLTARARKTCWKWHRFIQLFVSTGIMRVTTATQNLDNWKSSRRKRVEHIIDRVVEVKKLEEEEYDRNRRKSKTFNELMEER